MMPPTLTRSDMTKPKDYNLVSTLLRRKRPPETCDCGGKCPDCHAKKVEDNEAKYDESKEQV